MAFEDPPGLWPGSDRGKQKTELGGGDKHGDPPAECEPDGRANRIPLTFGSAHSPAPSTDTDTAVPPCGEMLGSEPKLRGGK